MGRKCLVIRFVSDGTSFVIELEVLCDTMTLKISVIGNISEISIHSLTEILN